MNKVILLLSLIAMAACAHTAKKEAAAPADQKSVGEQAIKSLGGCYLVDYSYTESEGVKTGYARDSRIYDPNRNKAIKEWIYSEDTGPNKVRVQHILFAVDNNGEFVKGSELKHQAEDWEYKAPYLYEFVGPAHWEVKSLPADQAQWTRRITNLDDGLRYQCAAAWKTDVVYPEWTCANYSPIPGRETRDMKRSDYDTMARTTRVIAYGGSWVERQENVKTQFDGGKKTALAKEVGKNWYVRVPDSDCSVVRQFADERKEFWALLRDTWDGVLDGHSNFQEKTTKPPRFAKMMELEESYQGKDLRQAAVRAKAKEDILRVINDYREPGKSASN